MWGAAEASFTTNEVNAADAEVVLTPVISFPLGTLNDGPIGWTFCGQCANYTADGVK